MINVLDKLLEPTNSMIKKLIDIEKSYINTTHPDFLGPEQSVLNLFDERNDSNTTNRNFPINSYQSNQRENINISSNFNTVKKNKIKEKDDEQEEDKREDTTSILGSNLPSNMRPGFPTSRDMMETCIIKNLISSYFNVVKKNISDIVPKTIMCLLVNESKQKAENEMINQLYKSSELEVLLQEDPLIAKKRKIAKETLQNLQQSLDVLSEIKQLKL